MKYTDTFSRGCQSCQQGSWLCIFLTYLCNVQCSFCTSPYKGDDKIISAFGDDPSTILTFLNRGSFRGISFSGGECLLVFDRLIEWLSFFKSRFPDIYYWVYTNGLAVDEDKLGQLARAGLDEIRFNIAATDYDSSAILKKIEMAAKVIENVAIEIPSIPADYPKLIDVLPFLDRIRVKYLNLHEYILMPDDPQSETASAGTFILNHEMKVKYDAYSLQNTERVRRFCQEKKLGIRVNNCSLRKKEIQMSQRRIAMGNIVKRVYEQVTPEGFLKTYIVHPTISSITELRRVMNIKKSFDDFEEYYIHPEDFEKNDSHLTGRAALLSFLPPMEIGGRKRFYRIEAVSEVTPVSEVAS